MKISIKRSDGFSSSHFIHPLGEGARESPVLLHVKVSVEEDQIKIALQVVVAQAVELSPVS